MPVASGRTFIMIKMFNYCDGGARKSTQSHPKKLEILECFTYPHTSGNVSSIMYCMDIYYTNIYVL